jgi:major membrane immunogen (membrane-anchored lipoprotein)
VAKVKRALVVTVSLFLLLTNVQADDVSWTSNRGLFDVTYESELEPLQINVLHSWIVHLEDADGMPVLGAKIEADGGMPEHDHGLPTRPRITQELGDGDYRLEGLRFHMRGDWEVVLTITVDAKTDVVVVTVVL